ncbi:MAG: cytochrome c5 family protein [Pseudomonadales bacterium]|nr:cytochrome c5 family protein [Pseudomonadales bacterium]
MLRPLAIVFLLLVTAACSNETTPALDADEQAELEAAFEGATMTPRRQAQWAHSCALCHVRGEGGAPRVGDQLAWKERVAAGNAWLLKHTLEGKGQMPPLGYCMDCEASDFAAMINMMSGQK